MKVTLLLLGWVVFFLPSDARDQENRVTAKSEVVSDTACIKMTELSLDSTSRIVITILALHDNQICRKTKTVQKIDFFNHHSVVKSIDVDTVALLKTKENMCCSYLLNQIGVDTIKNHKFYVLCFYLANGEPEIYLFYDKAGTLLFFQTCNRTECKNIPFNFNKKLMSEYFGKTTNINFVDVQ